MELIQVRQEILNQAENNQPTKEELSSLYQNIIKAKVKDNLFLQIRNIIEKYAATLGKLKVVIDPFIEKIDGKGKKEKESGNE